LDRDAIERSRTRILTADLVLVVLDSSIAEAPDQIPPWIVDPALRRAAGRVRVVLNKIDLPPGHPSPGAGAGGTASDAVRVSAKSGEGIEVLKDRVLEWLGLGDDDGDRVGFFTERQLRVAGEISLMTGADEMAGAVRRALLGETVGE
jgi:tRNA U34 5-carboxymethylaminomethyl modifying GTPase MnmE/TrmE